MYYISQTIFNFDNCYCSDFIMLATILYSLNQYKQVIVKLCRTQESQTLFNGLSERLWLLNGNHQADGTRSLNCMGNCLIYMAIFGLYPEYSRIPEHIVMLHLYGWDDAEFVWLG